MRRLIDGLKLYPAETLNLGERASRIAEKAGGMAPKEAEFISDEPITEDDIEAARRLFPHLKIPALPPDRPQ